MRPRTVPSERSLLVLLALLSILVSFAATPAASAPPPEPFCGPCGGSFTEEARWYGETNGVQNVTFGVEHSTATIRVHDNGTATWAVENRLASEETARYFRENGWMLDEIAENAGPGSSLEPETFLDARVVGTKTVVLRYRTTAAATAPGGVVRFDGFRHAREGSISGLGADRLTVVGPPGTVVTRAPRGASVDGNSFTVTAFSDVGDGPFVAFAGSGGISGEAWSLVAVTQPLLDDIALNLLLDVLLPAGVLFGLLAGFVRLGGREGSRNERPSRLVAVVVFVLGVLALLVGTVRLTDAVSGYSMALVVAGGTYVVLGLLAFSDARPTFYRTVAAVLLAWLVGLCAAMVAAIAVDSPVAARLFASNPYATRKFLFGAFSVLLASFMTAVGYAAAVRRHRRLALGAPPAALAVVLALTTSITRVRGPNDLLFTLFLLVYVLVFVSLIGLPAFLLGRTVPEE
ncbi:hypothetical protein [Haladaptatus sp. DYF46]|uniref:hypothetical protein n=1 Tax=Haladaptatus sp. DYF46 TaxID=2886041 RepID=UPI001E38E5F3|nr:hypothetical protein [Haladaptatus sp. DYF46]